jgi:hypothetical protein
MQRGGSRVPTPVDPATRPWFLPGGQPCLFYSERDGRMEFFDRPGRHPLSDVPLQPVTTAVRRAWEQLNKTVLAKKEVDRRLQDIDSRVSPLETPLKPVPSLPLQSPVETELGQRGRNDFPTSDSPSPFPRQEALSSQSLPLASKPSPTAVWPSTGVVTNFEPISPPRPYLPPVHRTCGIRHWPWARCPLLGLPRPRIATPRHRLCGYFHWPNEPCPAKRSSLCRTFSN